MGNLRNSDYLRHHQRRTRDLPCLYLVDPPFLFVAVERFKLPTFRARIWRSINCAIPLCFVRQVRLELTPGCPDYPLKVACLPFHHCRISVWINWFQTDLDRLHHCNSFKSRRTITITVLWPTSESAHRVVPVWMEGLEPSLPEGTCS